MWFNKCHKSILSKCLEFWIYSCIRTGVNMIDPFEDFARIGLLWCTYSLSNLAINVIISLHSLPTLVTIENVKLVIKWTTFCSYINLPVCKCSRAYVNRETSHAGSEKCWKSTIFDSKYMYSLIFRCRRVCSCWTSSDWVYSMCPRAKRAAKCPSWRPCCPMSPCSLILIMVSNSDTLFNG